MNNKRQLVIAALALSIILVFSVSCKQKENKPEVQTPEKPNIIYILADDLGYAEIGAYGQEKIETPNIDALAKSGMLFTQHYTGAPVCAPARTSLMTGMHMGHAPVRGNDEWGSRGDVWSYVKMAQDSTLEGQAPLGADVVILPSLLKKAGYTNGMFGKWGLGAPHTESIPTKMGFDYFFGYNCQRQAHTYNPLHLYENEIRYHLANDTVPPGAKLKEGEDPYDKASYARYNQPFYSPKVSFEKMIAFVDRAKDEPFFLYWATPIPHAALQAPKQWVDYYVKKFGDEEPYDAVYNKETHNGGYFPVRYPHATYAAMVSYFDENIGKLIAHLKEIGEYENTLIIFSSDNGPTYNGGSDSPWFDSAKPFKSEYGRGKGFVYEGGIRVPMIASWPGRIVPGTTTDHISAFWDVMPTLCEVAQVETPSNTDGISFLNTLTQEGKQREHDYMYWEFPEYNGQVAVRMGKWKMVWKNIKKNNTHIELYNLEEDIAEQNDISETYPELIVKFKEIIKKEHHTPVNKRFIMPTLEELTKSEL
ncbi:arylsulfatase [Aestuariivivens sp. NBU2969]|uniref:arylsulfatase n=1 Tax=Aestuariivivens sp. NBU2969 TaxID=2873267 RepID=UPI001CBCCE6B|nr:arylsulfatase [Aestuariivivens sp. NBU2969]